MKRIVFRLMTCAIAAAALCSCASAGKKFRHENVWKLELGISNIHQAAHWFGAPQVAGAKTTSDGKFDLLRYRYGVAGFGSAQTRELILEFRDGQLNAFFYGSSFEADKIRASLERTGSIRIGASAKDDVLRALGDPSGKARCPSMLADYKELCAKGVEVWAWATWERLNLYRPGQPVASARIYVTFDAAGKVTDVQTAHLSAP